MKKVLILSVLLFLSAQCYAQKIRFNDTTNVWVSCSSDPFDQKVDQYGNVLKASTSYRITGDTLLNGNVYCYHPMFHAWIREDTNSGKLYYRMHADSADRLFMDLAMQPGDSLYKQ